MALSSPPWHFAVAAMFAYQVSPAIVQICIVKKEDKDLDQLFSRRFGRYSNLIIFISVKRLLSSIFRLWLFIGSFFNITIWNYMMRYWVLYSKTNTNNIGHK